VSFIAFLGYIAIQLSVNVFSLLFSDYFISGVKVAHDFVSLLKIAAFISAFNIFLRPLVKLIFGPIIILTFGIFMILVNAALLWFASQLIGGLNFETLFSLIMCALIFSVANFLILLATKRK
jgi:putative membrane protein